MRAVFVAKPGSCALCKEQKTLVDSHMIPKFFLRAATSEIHEGKRTGLREISVMSFGDKPKSWDTQEGSFERPHGLVRKLLCRECESKFGKWEDYARRTLYGNLPGPEIRKQELGESISAQLGLQSTNAKGFRDLREVSINYEKFKLSNFPFCGEQGLTQGLGASMCRSARFRKIFENTYLMTIPDQRFTFLRRLSTQGTRTLTSKGFSHQLHFLRRRRSICTEWLWAAIGGFSGLGKVSRQVWLHLSACGRMENCGLLLRKAVQYSNSSRFFCSSFQNNRSSRSNLPEGADR